jgi:hypothetical protein
MTFEYDTIDLPFRMGILKQGIPDIRAALNAKGRDGWQLKQMILPSQYGSSDTIIAILERAVD